MAGTVSAQPSVASRRPALIAAFSARALDSADLDALLSQAAACAAQGFGAERAKVLKPRPDGDLLGAAGVGWRAGVVRHATRGSDLASPPGRAYRTGEAVVILDRRDQSAAE